MRLTTRSATRHLHLPGTEKHRISIQRGLSVRMLDGSWLQADRFYPRDAQDVPLVVMTGMLGGERMSHALLARRVAERGYQVLLHGDRVNAANGDRAMDADDRRVVQEWLREQDWFPGTITALTSL